MKSLLWLLLALSLVAWLVQSVGRQRARRELKQLFTERDDRALCRSVCNFILKKRGESELGTWPAHERTAVLAYDVAHIIGNGGFAFLFGSDLTGDPNYRASLAALEAIAAEQAATSYRAALALFVSGVAPLDLERRRAAVNEFPEADLERIDHAFLDAIPEVESRVGAYLRKHQAELESGLAA